MKRIVAVVLGALVMTPGVATAEWKQVPVVRLSAETEIAAPPAVVWAWVTTGKNLVTWCPEWKSEKNMIVNLGKVGDALDFTDAWGNNGRSIVTYYMKDKELRVAHEPNDGSYVCQAKIQLAPTTAKGTKVTYVEQYTDEGKPEDMKSTADNVQAEMMKTLAALKKGAEKK